jgi:hypothetical protein
MRNEKLYLNSHFPDEPVLSRAELEEMAKELVNTKFTVYSKKYIITDTWLDMYGETESIFYKAELS